MNTLREFKFSLRSVIKAMPDTPITILTDSVTAKELDTIDTKQVSVKIVKETGGFNWDDKINGFLLSPYGRTIFLDTDTYICGDLSEIFRVLDKFDVAVAHDPLRQTRGFALHETPASFPEFNTGVVAFKNSESFEAFVADWHSRHRDLTELTRNDPLIPFNDQISFRASAFYFEDVRIATLPPEYNYRPAWPGYAKYEVKVVHFRGNLEAVAKRLNRRAGQPRSFRTNLIMDVRYRVWVRLRSLLSKINKLATRH